MAQSICIVSEVIHQFLVEINELKLRSVFCQMKHNNIK